MTFEEAVKVLCLTSPFTEEPLTPEELTDVLKDDVVLAVKRPGSWEGANMRTVLQSHGFFNDW